MNRPRSRRGGRPAASRTVRLVPLHRTGLDHRELARILLAIMSNSHDGSGNSSVVEGANNSGSSAQSDDLGVTPASEGTTTTSITLAISSARRAMNEERRL